MIFNRIFNKRRKKPDEEITPKTKVLSFPEKFNNFIRPRPCLKKDCLLYDKDYTFFTGQPHTYVLKIEYVICLMCKHYIRDLDLYKKKEG